MDTTWLRRVVREWSSGVSESGRGRTVGTARLGEIGQDLGVQRIVFCQPTGGLGEVAHLTGWPPGGLQHHCQRVQRLQLRSQGDD